MRFEQVWRQHQTLILRLMLIFVFFTLPFVKLTPHSMVAIPKLEIVAYPPGYPVDGQSWSIQVLGSQDNGVLWSPIDNATVCMTFSSGSSIIYHTDLNGVTTVMYSSSLGLVSFQATASGYLDAVWTPVERFVSSTAALFVIGLYGAGGPTIFWSVLADYRKQKAKEAVWNVVFWVSLTTAIVGGLLSLSWFRDWGLGAEWGFSNSIIGPILYNPDLFYITAILVMSTTILALRTKVFKPHPTKPRPKQTRAKASEFE